jgi:MFS family permease
VDSGRLICYSCHRIYGSYLGTDSPLFSIVTTALGRYYGARSRSYLDADIAGSFLCFFTLSSTFHAPCKYCDHSQYCFPSNQRRKTELDFISIYRAPNIGALLSCRFIAGFFAAAPLTLAGGAISDVWDTNERGFAIALFAAAPYGGPVLGPIVGGFVGETIGWRWTLWVNMIFAGVVTLSLATVPETYAPVILKHRAKKIRQESGDNSYVTEQEAFKRPLAGIVVETLVRPFQMLVQEPILLLMSLYIALIYGLVRAILVICFRLTC